MTATLTIGQLARAAQVGVETIRFYEREGLLDAPSRRASGYRQFPPQVVDRLRFIRRAKGLGFTLREVKELLDLRLDPQTTCGDIRLRAQSKIADIDGKIKALRRMKQSLERRAAACDGRGSIGECPILEALDETLDERAADDDED